MNTMSRIVIALGGNALGNTAQEQQERIEQAAPSLIGLIKQGNEILVSHGNGPQVGISTWPLTKLPKTTTGWRAWICPNARP